MNRHNYKTGSPASGWTITDLYRFTYGGSNYVTGYYGRYASAAGIIEVLGGPQDGYHAICPEDWSIIYAMQVAASPADT